jgi:putative hydrolase of the HAD superfamily
VIRAIVSDLGGVLTTPVAGSFARFCGGAGIEPADLGHALAAIRGRDGAHPLHELECGRMTQEAFLALLAASLRERVGREVELEDFAESVWAGLRPNEPMLEFMAARRRDGYRMALLTNNVREWESRWRALAPIEDIFELMVDRAFVGVRKPDSEIYELTVRRLGVPAPECLFIDDSEENCAGARDVGLRAVVYRNLEQAIAEISAALG